MTKKVNMTLGELEKAYRLISTARAMSDLFEENAKITGKYVHACSRGHEAIQVALGIQLKAQDWLAPYYRDDAMLLSIGLEPFELMLQLLAKKEDPYPTLSPIFIDCMAIILLFNVITGTKSRSLTEEPSKGEAPYSMIPGLTHSNRLSGFRIKAAEFATERSSCSLLILLNACI